MVQYDWKESSERAGNPSGGAATAGITGAPMSPMAKTMKQAKRMIILIFGITVICLGIAMIVLPGPAFIVIPLGLAVLGTEFVWARKLLHGIKERLPDRVQSKVDGAGAHFKEKFDRISKKVKEKLGKTGA